MAAATRHLTWILLLKKYHSLAVGGNPANHCPGALLVEFLVIVLILYSEKDPSLSDSSTVGLQVCMATPACPMSPFQTDLSSAGFITIWAQGYTKQSQLYKLIKTFFFFLTKEIPHIDFRNINYLV